MESGHPRVVVIGGPNGAGKTTIAKRLLPGQFGIQTFVNADIIAQGLSLFDPGRVAMAAGRIMLARLKELAANREDFAFETTLASRTFEPWLRSLIAGGYRFHLVLVWVPGADTSIQRVTNRVSHGGHFVPEDTIRRRYVSCFRNFFSLYQPIATTWLVLDNSIASGPELIARGEPDEVILIQQPELWSRIVSEYRDAD